MGQCWGSQEDHLGMHLPVHVFVCGKGRSGDAAVTGQAEHLILAAGGIHFLLISVYMGTFLSSKGLSIQTSQRRTGCLPTGNMYSPSPSFPHGPGAVAALPVEEMDLALPCSLCLLKTKRRIHRQVLIFPTWEQKH